MDSYLAADMWVKLALATACGAAIGIERELHDKPAGLRTNILICVGSTLMTMVSIHVALTYATRQVNIADPARIAAQIVSGIGFLGAGTIIQARGSVHGLTTAATIWVMAGVGLAIGAGVYAYAIATTIIILATLIVLGWLETHFTPRRRFVYFHVLADRRPGLIDDINELAERERLSLDDFALKRQDEGFKIEFALSLAAEKRDAVIDSLLDLEGVRDRNLAILQVANRLGDYRLSIPRRAVHEHRVSGRNGRPELVEHLLADHQVRKGVADACARHGTRDHLAIRLEIGAVLVERDGCDTDVLVMFQKEQRAAAALIRDPVAVRRPPNHRAAGDFTLMGPLQKFEDRLDDRKLQTDSTRQLQARVIGGEVHHLQQELGEEVLRQPGLLEGTGCERMKRGERRRRIEHAWLFGGCYRRH